VKKFLFLLLLIGQQAVTQAQGCSDAGFCSLSVLKNNVAASKNKHSIQIGSSFGIGEENTQTINPYIAYQQQFNKKWSVQAKLTATSASGFLGNSFNIGDFFAFATHTSTKDSTSSLTWLGGIKIPLTDANNQNKANISLPLDYQSSIGTYDVIVGVNYIFKKHWEINGGLQLPIIQQNKNAFFPTNFTDERAKSFAPTNLFKRSADVLARVGYYVQIPSQSIVIKPNLLAIYHVAEDTYVNTAGIKTALDGSAGLTLNGGIIATKTFKNNHQLELVAATPFVVRTIRPDGLTRSLVFNIQYNIQF